MNRSTWNRDVSLRHGRAQTRDGRWVFNLSEAVLEVDGQRRPVLVGDVTLAPAPFPPGRLIKWERHLWEAGGLGSHGGDDLLNHLDERGGASGQEAPG